MSDKVYPVPSELAATALIDDAGYKEMYARSVEDPDGLLGRAGKRIDWIKPYTRVKNTSLRARRVSIKWFEDGTLNVAANCIDRHLADARRPDRDHLGRRRPATRPQRSPTASCTPRSAASPTC